MTVEQDAPWGKADHGEGTAVESTEADKVAAKHPYRGDEMNESYATVCPGFDPEPLRYLYYQPAMRILIIFGAIVGLLTVGAFAAGYALRVPGGGWWPGVLAFLSYGVGIVIALVGVLDLLFLGLGYSSSAKGFKNALLTPGVLDS
jgi:hypothetical protein